MRSKKAIYNIITNLILQVAVVIYGFIVPKIIITNFGSEVNGLISSITQFLAYISLFEAGFGGVVQYLLYKPIASKNLQELNNILKASQKFFKKVSYIFILYIFVLIIIYPNIINSNFDYFYTVSLIIIISISTFFEYYLGLVYKIYLLAEQKTYIISIFSILTYILNIIIVFIFAKLGFSIHAIKLITALIFVLRPVMQSVYVRKKYRINIKVGKDGYIIKQKWDALAQHIASVIHTSTDITVLSIFCKLSEVSVYSIYALVVNGVKQLVSSFYGSIDSSFGDMIARNEKQNLLNKFGMYEVIYNAISTICFACTIILIVPFVSIYTSGITDVNYIRYTFGYLLVISEFIAIIRMPYSTLIKAAGHYKETRIGAWVEAGLNIIISIILVSKFGLVGVAVGTMVAMTVRTIEFIYHVNKYILNRSIFVSVKRISLLIINFLLIVLVCKYLPYLNSINYINWIVNALMTFVVASIITIIINLIFYKNEMKLMCNIIKQVLLRRGKHE